MRLCINVDIPSIYVHNSPHHSGFLKILNVRYFKFVTHKLLIRYIILKKTIFVRSTEWCSTKQSVRYYERVHNTCEWQLSYMK